MMVKFISQNAILSGLLSLAMICNLGICNEQEKQILLSFKSGVIDPSGMLSTWSIKEDCCDWKGVECDITGRVTNLTLPCSTDDESISILGSRQNKSHCLTGELHLSLLQLQFLKYLDLSNNNFQAINYTLPLHGSGNSSTLIHLDLSSNEILLIDDLRWLLSLSSLQYLNLNFIDLHKQTQWLQLFNLPSLSELHLRSCLLENINNPYLHYVNFTSLEYLDLSHNDFFSELPNWLFNLSGLSYLSLKQNRFYGQIPNQLLNLRNLNFLRLKDNRLSGTIPNWVGQLGSLQYLDLSYNLFIGPIPTTLGNLSSLIALDVVSNKLNGSLPQSLGHLHNLQVLGVGENSLSGVVSHRNFAKLSNLQNLWLSSPSFIFEFDPHWIPPFQLQDLILGYVDLKLFPWLYTQTSLSCLTIEHSLFTLESQENFWSSVANLRFLSLFNNSMHWDMSNVLLNSEIIWLLRNGLRGGLPQLTSNVRVFSIGSNNLSGPLSPLLCHKMKGESNLKYLSIFQNILSEGLTDCWVNWKSLVHVDLGNNNLTGMIPHSMGTLSNLMSLHIDNNKLHGKIPLSLKSCQKLVILNLQKNKFSGSVPTWMGQSVKALQLRSNQFSGDIPLQICQLSSLIVLDVANNRLSGAIPHCLHNITGMVFNNASIGDMFGIIIEGFEYISFISRLSLVTKGNELDYGEYAHVIDLSSNFLSGKIPSELCMLTGLQSLNFSQNQLWGTIPEEIGNLKQLESLDFSNNKLSGEIPQSMSSLSFLGFLNLSFNNFEGKIPSGTQLQSFTALSYIGNSKLCGAPLMKNCTHDEAPNDTELHDKNFEILEWFYMGMGVGFAISFWVVCGSLFLIKAWRYAYFKFLNDMKDQLYQCGQ
ncbi:hypothetical protein VNO77_39293 [Canavalia gladiata]|uniref:Leucine-rich repeat-containing N-terminal plant-type domain-containing protein n=1 Tax=Canavalia gladiata TaxID=3824 RepID=A0AAN9KBY1_CANGL